MKKWSRKNDEDGALPLGTTCTRCGGTDIRRHGRMHGVLDADPTMQIYRCMGCHRLFYMPHGKVD